MAGRSLLLVWDVSADQEEPWRRFLQELSDAGREEEYVQSRRRLGISIEAVWLVAKAPGGGIAVVYLEADDPKWALGELAASEAPFDSCYSGGMRAKLLGFDLARLSRAASGKLLFAWRDGGPREREEEPENS